MALLLSSVVLQDSHSVEGTSREEAHQVALVVALGIQPGSWAFPSGRSPWDPSGRRLEVPSSFPEEACTDDGVGQEEVEVLLDLGASCEGEVEALFRLELGKAAVEPSSSLLEQQVVLPVSLNYQVDLSKPHQRLS